jgi:hypothetical protein
VVVLNRLDYEKDQTAIIPYSAPLLQQQAAPVGEMIRHRELQAITAVQVVVGAVVFREPCPVGLATRLALCHHRATMAVMEIPLLRMRVEAVAERLLLEHPA